MRRLLAILAVTVSAGLACGPALAATPPSNVQPYGTNDYGGFRSIMPPGNNGFDDLAQLGAFEASEKSGASPAYPANSHNQFDEYQNLLWGYPTLTDATIPDYFTNATFGVPPGEAGTTYTPEPGATIVYDKDLGIPHIYGDTRAEMMFAAGYACAQSRLFEMDVLRHVGRADLAGFAGGANANQDALQWAIAPYTSAELNDQAVALSHEGPLGAQVYQDGLNYIAGVNLYIAQAKKDPLTMMPGEYDALGMTGGPAPFVPGDLVAIASAIAGVEGDGGGTELAWTVLMQDLQKKLGRAAGERAMLDFHSIDDPATPTTVHGVRFPYDTIPAKVIPGSEAIPDPGSVVGQTLQTITSGPGDPQPSTVRRTALQITTEHERFGGMFPNGDSNALLISAKDSASGHPLALMGPQIGYFTPQILFEEDLHGPGVDAEGAAIPGVSQYVVLGHGEDYAWSATSGYEGITSTFAVPLCNPSGGVVTTSSDDYLEHGRCVPMTLLQTSESWKPNFADSTPAGSQTLTAYRTDFGLVEARATIHGKPVAYTEDRSTYDHELDSAIGFMLFDEPDAMRDASDFQAAASHIGYAFNWFYADDKHIAYFNSGLLPVRHPGTNPLFPTMSTYPWVGFDPADNTSEDEPAYVHPQVIDQPYLTSWNNKEAAGYSGTDSLTEDTSVWRSQLLDDGIQADLAHGHKMTLAELIQVMENAGTIDLRGEADLPYLLRVVGTPSSPALANAVSELRAWMDAGAHRASPSYMAPYTDAAAIQIMDAWWPLLTQAMFEPTIGPAAWSELQQVSPDDQPPNTQVTSPGGGGQVHEGSAWDIGFYGTVQTDLRQILKLHPAGALSRVYCGGGSLTRCRALLQSTLAQAIGESATQVYPGYTGCKAGNPVCWDAIDFRAVGAITQPLMQWVNRPTYQQADEIQGHRPFPAVRACIYAEYPTVRITSIRLTQDFSGRGSPGAITLSGTATPRDCGVPSARIVRVQVRRGRGRWVTARGTTRWTVKVAGSDLTIHVRAIDASGNVATRGILGETYSQRRGT